MQGEGILAGMPTVFVRTGGCDWRCVWCLAPETTIWMADNNIKRIDNLQIDDQLLTWDEKTSKFVETTVKDIVSRDMSDLYKITFKTYHTSYEITCSGSHLWYTKQYGWLTTKDIYTIDNKSIFCMFNVDFVDVDILKLDDDFHQIMYDIRCEPYSTFFAGALLTHNCDSLHAVLPEFAHSWTKYTPEELFEEVKTLAPKPMTVTLSGGNPALQPFDKFIDILHQNGYSAVIETQGTVSPEWFKKLAHVVLSPKPPSSGMIQNWDEFDQCILAAPKKQVSIKIVIMNEQDYQFARFVHQKYSMLPLYLSVGNDNPPHYSSETNYGSNSFNKDSIVERTEWLLKRVTEDTWINNLLPRVLPQVHTLLWGNKQGV